MASQVSASGLAPAQPLRFFAVGDAPYSSAEEGPFRRLLDDAAAASPDFIVHVGDIKGGSQPCSDARDRGVASLFAALPVPVLYTPGDNEWTDCHRRAAGLRDPLARLQALRRIFFGDPQVLHNQALGLVAPNKAFPENAYLIREGVVVVLLHLVGSKNNHRPQVAVAMQEWRDRSLANRALLARATDAATTSGARAMVLLFHGNPSFQRRGQEPGYRPFFEDLERLLARYPGPVLGVHGDTHRFQFNQPLQGIGEDGERFWRLEVPGSPFIGGVWVAVTDDPVEPFAIELTFPSALDGFEEP